MHVCVCDDVTNVRQPEHKTSVVVVVWRTETVLLRHVASCPADDGGVDGELWGRTWVKIGNNVVYC